MKNILIIVFCFYNLNAFAGGGTVVGNGAGVVESSFQQAYTSLDKFIPSCLAVEKCGLTNEDKIMLGKIQKIVKLNVSRKDRLVFLSEALNPGFFTTGNSEVFRIAKTFLTSDASIYINTDMLYNEDGHPAIKFQDIVRILIHELGHQTGYEQHACLDILGSKVAVFSEDSTLYYRFRLEEENSSVTFAVTNFDLPVKSTFVLFDWKNAKIENLTDAIIAQSPCVYDSEAYSGIEVINGHFTFDENALMSFEAWINVSCNESLSGAANVYRRNLTVNLDSEYKIMKVSVK